MRRTMRNELLHFLRLLLRLILFLPRLDLSRLITVPAVDKNLENLARSLEVPIFIRNI